MFWETVFRNSAALVSIGIIVNCLEVYAAGGHYLPGGLLDWNVVRAGRLWTLQGKSARILDFLFSPSMFMGLNAVRLAAAVSLVLVAADVLQNHAFEVAGLVVLFLTTGAFHFRNATGLDGSDQMTIILCAVLMLRSFAPQSEVVTFACAGFIAFQAGLAYTTSGVAKCISKEWRSGIALAGVMNTSSYGWQAFALLLLKHQSVARFLSWTIITYQIAFPSVFLLGRYAWLVLAGGMLFHALNAAIMGLNGFFWAFVGTYPIVWGIALELARVLPR